MDMEQSTKNFLLNDLRFLTIGEVAKELSENRASMQGLQSQVEDLQKKLAEALNHVKELTESKRKLEQELGQAKG